MPFQSEKQRRYLWANEPEIARDWADTYGSRIEKNDGGITRLGYRFGGHPGASHEGVGSGQTSGGFNTGQERGGRLDVANRKSVKTKGADVRDSHHPPRFTPIGFTPTTPQDRGGGQYRDNRYLEWLASQKSTEDEEEDYDFNRDFQDSLTSAATTPDYFVGETPLASNLAWGKKMGVDPRTMGLTSWADGGRIPAAFGGIMDTATGRRAYGLGSIFKSIGKAAKKVFKSPIGKAAILYAGGAYLGGMSAFGGAGGSFMSRLATPSNLMNLANPGGWSKGNILNSLFRKAVTNDAGKFLKWGGGSPWKVGIAAASALPFLMGGPEEDDEGDKGSNYDVLRDKYAQELMNIKSGLSAGSLNPDQWSYLPSDYTYKGAEGGRAGYYAGGQSTPSDYTVEDAMMTTTQDKLAGITDVMKQADLYRQGSVGQMYAAQGGRIGFAGGMNEKLAELKKAYNTYVKGGGTLSFEQFSTAFAEENFAEGGRIGADEGGLMDLGGMEKDYRNDGGFVPLGGEEKADDVPARLSKNEFVFTADAVRGAGGGDIDKGAEIMENIMKNLEQGGQISEETQGLSGAQEMFGVSERLSEVV